MLCVCEGVCEAPTFTERSTMMVPTYPEDGSRALKVYQHQHHGCAGRAQGACRQSSRNNYLETALADSAETFTVAQRVPPSVRP